MTKRRNVTLYLPEGLVERAHKLSINISALMEEILREEIKNRKTQRGGDGGGKPFLGIFSLW